VTGCFEQDINPFGSTKCGELQDYLRTYKVFFKDSPKPVASPSVECSYSTCDTIYLLATIVCVVTRWQYTFTHKQYIEQNK